MSFWSDNDARIRDQALAAAERERTVFTVRSTYKPDRGTDSRLDQLITTIEAGTPWRLTGITPLGSGDNLLLLFRPETSVRPH